MKLSWWSFEKQLTVTTLLQQIHRYAGGDECFVGEHGSTYSEYGRNNRADLGLSDHAVHVWPDHVLRFECHHRRRRNPYNSICRTLVQCPAGPAHREPATYRSGSALHALPAA